MSFVNIDIATNMIKKSQRHLLLYRSDSMNINTIINDNARIGRNHNGANINEPHPQL